jgi:hypothetical protein
VANCCTDAAVAGAAWIASTGASIAHAAVAVLSIELFTASSFANGPLNQRSVRTRRDES